MSYDLIETSEYDSFPIELYTFNRNTIGWRYTSADEDKVVNLVPYTAIPIKRSGLEQNQDTSRSPITITMDKNTPFLMQFRGSPPTDIVMLTIQRYHEGDGELTTPWVGRVVNVKFLEREAEIRCEPVYTSIKRPVLRRRYQTTCPHVLYGQQCRLLSSGFVVQTNLSAVSGVLITASAFGTKPDGYFAGGYMDWETGGVLERRFILSHTGATLTLNLPYKGIPSNATVRAYPGCDHALSTCHNKFNNVDNYGGQPFYPSKNPFTGSPIF